MISTATTALPYPHLQRATAGLRAELRHQLLDDGTLGATDWSSPTVGGPREFNDGRGRVWFGDWASLTTPASADSAA